MADLSAELKIRLEPELRRALEEEALALNRKPSEVARIALREYLARRRQARQRGRRVR